MAKTLIIYKTDSPDAQGWEQRLLQPSGHLTDTLAEEIDFSGRLPKLGERLREYIDLPNPGDESVHGGDADWLVSRIEQFSSFDTDTRIVLCYCTYSPVEPNYQPLKRGRPVDELMSQEAAK